MIGPVDAQCAQALRAGQREVLLPASSDEASIFYNISMDRVYYFPERQAIYYVDSRYVGISDLIASVFRGFGETLLVDQLYLDRLNIFKSVKRVRLAKPLADAVMVALRLQGVRITISI